MSKRTTSKTAATAATPLAFRQGDVLILSVDHPAAGTIGDVEPVPVDPRGVVLAEGESSFHHHAVIGRGGDAKLMRFRDARADRLIEIGTGGADVRVIGGGSGGVDRHTPISLDAGRYIVRIQKSYTAGHVQRVAD